MALAIWIALSVCSIAAALRLLGVRDWRCLGALFLTHPVEQSVRLGTLMPVLTLLLALLWKYRDRLWTGAGLAAVVVVSKLFRHLPGQSATDLAATKVTGIRINPNGREGFVQLSSPAIPTGEMFVLREGNTWKAGVIIGEACSNCSAG